MVDFNSNIIGTGINPTFISPLETVTNMNKLIGDRQTQQDNAQNLLNNQNTLDTKNKLNSLYNQYGNDYESLIKAAQQQGIGSEIPALEQQQQNSIQSSRLNQASNIESKINMLKYTGAVLQQANPQNYGELLNHIESVVGKTMLPRTFNKEAIDRANKTAQAISGHLENNLEQLKFQHQLNQDQQSNELRTRAQDLAEKQYQTNIPVEKIIGPNGMPINATRAESIGKQPYTSVDMNAGKPLPTQALKLQQEALDAIGIASSIDKDLGAIQTQIKSGKLPLGLISNAANSALNYTGNSTEESRNFGTFKSSLEKMRNDSLRLNKGVQTEGDAIRAWNELFQNINDPEMVNKRLTEIRNINTRGINYQKMNIDVIRSNYGKEGLDTSAYTNQNSAIKPSVDYGDATPKEIEAYKKKFGLQ